MKKLFNGNQKSQKLIELEDPYMRRLFQECKIGQGNAALLSQALTLSKPEDLNEQDVIKEFYHKSRSSQEFLLTKIPWAYSCAMSSREALNRIKMRKQRSSSDMGHRVHETPAEATTEAEDLLAALLAANSELNEVLKQYEDLTAAVVQQVNDQSSAGTGTDQVQLAEPTIDVSSVNSSLNGLSLSLYTSYSLHPSTNELDPHVSPSPSQDPGQTSALPRASLSITPKLDLHVVSSSQVSCKDDNRFHESCDAALQSPKALGKQKESSFDSKQPSPPSEGGSTFLNNEDVSLDNQNPGWDPSQLYEGCTRGNQTEITQQCIAPSTEEDPLSGVDIKQIGLVVVVTPPQRNSQGSSLMHEEVFEQTAEQNKIIEHLLAQAEEDQQLRSLYEQQINQVMEAYLTASRCEICFEIVEKQFSIRECGHTFCGICLRNTFTGELKPRLLAIASLAHYGQPQFDCQAIPTSKAHLRKTVQGIKKDTSRSPEAVFAYTCPWCRGLITKSPIIHFKYFKLLASLNDAVSSRLIYSPEYEVKEQEDFGVDYFEGFFLD